MTKYLLAVGALGCLVAALSWATAQLDEPPVANTGTEFREFMATPTGPSSDRAKRGTDLLMHGTSRRDYEMAFRLLREAARDGDDPIVFNNLGVMYEHGVGTEVDLSAALRFYGMGAQASDAVAQRNWAALILFRGVEGVEPERAVAALRSAAETGFPVALYDLAVVIQLHGDTPDEALRYLERSANSGYAPAIYRLAQTLHHGLGVPADYGAAVRYYEEAAKIGDVRAHANLAQMYDAGHGVERSLPKAIEHYSIAADGGHAEAQYNLAHLLASAEGDLLDPQRAFALAVQSGDQGFAPAQNLVALFYLRGFGTGASEEKATEWFLRAAENGLSTAQYNVGLRFLRGSGARQNNASAARWFCLAASQGHERAAERLQQMGISQCNS